MARLSDTLIDPSAKGVFLLLQYLTYDECYIRIRLFVIRAKLHDISPQQTALHASHHARSNPQPAST